MQFPAGLHTLGLVSLRAAAAVAVVSPFFSAWCAAGHAGLVVAARVAAVCTGAADAMPMFTECQSNC